MGVTTDDSTKDGFTYGNPDSTIAPDADIGPIDGGNEKASFTDDDYIDGLRITGDSTPVVGHLGGHL